MRFLIDRCAGRRLADWLRDQGHDVVETQDSGQDPGDVAILANAREERRVLVTIDTDFGQLIHLAGESHSGLVRLPDVRAPQRIALISAVLERHEPDLEAGAMIVVRGHRVRVSWPPAKE